MDEPLEKQIINTKGAQEAVNNLHSLYPWKSVITETFPSEKLQTQMVSLVIISKHLRNKQY